MIFRLKNTIQEYDWGSRTGIQNLLNIKDDKPMAELWMGAHPNAPSLVVTENKDVKLTEYIKSNPVKVLGSKTARIFGSELPFLFKVLAAGKSLSIQSHPDKKQAEYGFKAENKKNMPLTAFNRNYRDSNHKPELICALTDFWAMRGFRPIGDIADELKHLKLDTLEDYSARFLMKNNREELKNFFFEIMSMGKEKKKQVVKEVLERIKTEKEERYRWIKRLNSEHPFDIGVICPLLLNTIKLARGQAMFLPAGELHAYLSGTGIEIMANSDNVLRGGLTSKHIDVNELLKTLTFTAEIPEIILPDKLSGIEKYYNSPAEEFKLYRISPGSNEYTKKNIQSIEIIIITEGNCTIETQGFINPMEAGKGDSFVIEACTEEYSIKGNCEIYKASL
jgi:mannose-6-phosphate isomerase